MSKALIAIKGTPEGLLVTLQDGEWRDIWAELQAQLDRSASFLRGAQVILRMGAHHLDVETVQRVVVLFSQHNIAVTSVASESPATRRAAQKVGLRVEESALESDVIDDAAPITEKRGIIVRQSLRSGQKIMAEHGSVLIIGDVNSGAEVAAAGDVIVWGWVRGLVHAGAQGDDEAVICALRLEPPQLRIGSHIARAPEGERSSTPEIARVRDDEIVVESWKDASLNWQFAEKSQQI